MNEVLDVSTHTTEGGSGFPLFEHLSYVRSKVTVQLVSKDVFYPAFHEQIL